MMDLARILGGLLTRLQRPTAARIAAVLAVGLSFLSSGCERCPEGMPKPGSVYTFSNMDHGVPVGLYLRENNDDLYAPTLKLAHNVKVKIVWYSSDDKSVCLTVLDGPYAGRKGFLGIGSFRR